MEEQNNYEINLDDIILRRARIDDNLEAIARLIYQTDPYIYPYWFDNDVNKAIESLVPLIKEPGFLFYYENFYIAYAKDLKRIVGIVGAIDPTTNLEYDYTNLKAVNERYRFTIENYFEEIISEVREKQYMYLTNVCIDESYRGHRIGSRLLHYFIEQMHEAGFDEIGFDCLMHNLRAKNLYHSLGFKEVAEGIGFDGTDHSTVEIVFFKKKSTPFSSEDFQMLPESNVKEVDKKRENYLYDCFKFKESAASNS